MNPAVPVLPKVPTNPSPAPSQVPSEPASREMESQQALELAAVTVSSRISDFWCDQPALWFLHVEAILAPQKLADEHRFNLAVSKLPKEVIQQVSDLLRDPPASNKFQALKTRLISTYEESETKQFEKLLSQMELGEQKPSQLLRKMRELNHDRINEDTLSMLWMRHLPASLRGVLAVADTKNLENRAAMADKILETMRPVEIAELTTPSTSASYNHNAMHEEVVKLTAQIAQLTRKFNEQPRCCQARGRPRFFRSRSQSRSRNSPAQHRASTSNPQRTTKDRPDRTCFYHAKYGTKAHKCVAPCKFNQAEN